MLTTVPVSSVSLTGLPSPNWMHPWRELLPAPWWRGVDLAGLLEMPTRRPLTEPTEELGSGWTSSRSSGTMMWRPTIGPDENAAILVGEAMNTNMPRSLCKSRAVMFRSVIQCWWTDWTFRRIFGRGATVKRRTASRWTESLDLVWDRTSHSWWSSQETGAPWWLSGRAVGPVLGYLLWSTSRPSRHVASHLAALTA